MFKAHFSQLCMLAFPVKPGGIYCLAIKIVYVFEYIKGYN